ATNGTGESLTLNELGNYTLQLWSETYDNCYDEVVVTVSESGEEVPPPDSENWPFVTLEALPSHVEEGSTVDLSWGLADLDYCNVSSVPAGFWSGSVQGVPGETVEGGLEDVGPLFEDT